MNKSSVTRRIQAKFAHFDVRADSVRTMDGDDGESYTTVVWATDEANADAVARMFGERARRTQAIRLEIRTPYEYATPAI